MVPVVYTANNLAPSHLPSEVHLLPLHTHSAPQRPRSPGALPAHLASQSSPEAWTGLPPFPCGKATSTLLSCSISSSGLPQQHTNLSSYTCHIFSELLVSQFAPWPTVRILSGQEATLIHLSVSNPGTALSAHLRNKRVNGAKRHVRQRDRNAPCVLPLAQRLTGGEAATCLLCLSF